MLSTLARQGVTILLLTGWTLTTAGVGRLCLRALPVRFGSRGEQFFCASGIGLVAIGYAVFILGVAQAWQPLSLSLLLGGCLLLALAGWSLELPAGARETAAVSPWNRPASLLLALLLAAGFLLALTPEIGKDALIYHLAVPKLYLRHGGFFFVPGNVFAGYPLLGEMHYLLALYLDGEILAKTMHYAVFCGTLLGIGLLARYVFTEHALPSLSMLVFASIPSVFAVAHAAYNDLFVTFFTLAAAYAFLRFSEERATGWLVLCACFSGAAAASKYTALLLAPLGGLGILWLCHQWKTSTTASLRLLAGYGAVAFLFGSPFYLKNAIVTGNPFYPFFYGLFGGLGWDADQARVYDLFIRDLGMGRGWIDTLLLPWNLSFRARMDSPRFDGILGPIFFLTLPFLAGRRPWERPVRLLLACTVPMFLFWASSAQQIRYLIPLFSLLSVVVGALLTRYRPRRMLFVCLLCLVAGSLVFNGVHIARHFWSIRPLAVALGGETREQFLTRKLPVYPMYRLANRALPANSRVFLIYMKNFTFLCEHACYADAMFETHTLQRFLRQAASPGDLRDRLTGAGFTHLLYDDAFLLGDLSPLDAGEKGLFFSFRQRHLALIGRSGSYRLERLM